VSKEKNHAQHETHAKAERKEKRRESNSDGGRKMNISDLLFDSVYQIVTWVVIAGAIGGIYHFLSKDNWRGVLWSSIGLACAVAIMIGLIADRYFFRSATKETKQERPYVVFRELALQPLNAGNYPTIQYLIENTSKSEEVTVRFARSTARFTRDRNQWSLEYAEGIEPTTFRMAPTDFYHGIIRFPGMVLSAEDIKGLNEETLWLFFFAQYEYEDRSGNKYPEPFCRIYSPHIDGNLTICPPTVTIKQKEKSE
jgi:hypothetical protein